MTSSTDSLAVELFATCPQFMEPGTSTMAEPQAYLDQALQSAQWADRHGFKGMLIYTDNRQLDPWLLAQLVIQKTERLCPLVAVQPIYMHPYTVAKLIATIAYLYGRQIYLNMVAGGFRNDLIALNDPTPHDSRYDRLVEYSTIIRELLASQQLYTFEGAYHTVKNLAMTPPVPPELRPQFFVSGSSEAGMNAARAIGATAIQYPKPPGEYDEVAGGLKGGIRVGVIARASRDEAWAVAHERFPEDRQGEIAHKLAMKVSDSQWHGQLGEQANQEHDPDNPYWLTPYKHYKTFCPYLVGDYATVAKDLARYIRKEARVFIVDISPCEEEVAHTREAFEQAAALAQ